MFETNPVGFLVIPNSCNIVTFLEVVVNKSKIVIHFGGLCVCVCFRFWMPEQAHPFHTKPPLIPKKV